LEGLLEYHLGTVFTLLFLAEDLQHEPLSGSVGEKDGKEKEHTDDEDEGSPESKEVETHNNKEPPDYGTDDPFALCQIFNFGHIGSFLRYFPYY
jgi:hypothetical protein